MNRNLNYYVEGSKCYGDDPANCATYGRLYDWAMAMDFPNSCNTESSCAIATKHRGICPEGWRIPTIDEWDILSSYTKKSENVKAISGWKNCGPEGSGERYLCKDTYGFSALPGGSYSINYDSNDNPYYKYIEKGETGEWWSTSQPPAGNAAKSYVFTQGTNYYSDTEWSTVRWQRSKSEFISIRCVKD